MSFNGEKFGKEVVEIVKDFMHRQVEPMAAQIEQLEARILLLEAQVNAKEEARRVIRLAAPTRVAE